jgi:hypothetical protein
MVYRSDVDALEARLRALNVDIAQRERDRDEVVRLLRDRRNCDAAVQWLEDRPRRQRRRGVLAAVLLGGMIASGLVAYGLVPGKQQTYEKTLQDFAGFADQACQCPDAACVDRVGSELHESTNRIVKRGAYQVQPTEAQLARSREILARLMHCTNEAKDRARGVGGYAR